MIITKEGKDNLEIKLLELKDKLKALEMEKADAYKSTGDTWHDNPYFDLLRRDEETLVREIRNIEDLLNNASVIKTSSQYASTVNIGTKIKCIIEYSFDDEIENSVIEIVGHGESDLEKGKIAYDSPVGENLMGHKIGDIVSFEVPAGIVSYRIVDFV